MKGVKKCAFNLEATVFVKVIDLLSLFLSAVAVNMLCS